MIADHFDHLQDPRRAQGRLHRLDHILTVALCAVVAGAEGWADIATFGHAKAEWLTRRLRLPHGPPSADTVRRVLSAIEPDAFAEGFARWLESVATKTAGEVVAIDGKALRRSYHKDDPQAMIHMVSTPPRWGGRGRARNGSCWPRPPSMRSRTRSGQSHDCWTCSTCPAASSPSTRWAPRPRSRLRSETEGRTGRAYAPPVLALKGNQGTLDADVRDYFETLRPARTSTETVCYAETTDVGHGRMDVRRLWASSDTAWLAPRGDWDGLESLVMVECVRHTDAGVARQRRYYISSLPANGPGAADRLLNAVRSHWGVENGVHWVLDVVFREDESRVRCDHGGANLSALRHLALNLRRQTDSKQSLRMRRKRAGWDDSFLAEVIGL